MQRPVDGAGLGKVLPGHLGVGRCSGLRTVSTAVPVQIPYCVQLSSNRDVRGNMEFLVFDTQHANNIPTDSPEHGDHHGTLGMHRACIKHELPTSEGMTFFHTLRAQAQRVHHKADSRRGEAARGRSRAHSNGNRSHLTARHIFS